MKHKATAQYVQVIITGCALSLAGCGDFGQVKPEAAHESSSTAGQVCRIVAELLGVDRSKVGIHTSLGDLGADELDLVELVMELEEHFDIVISDAAVERIMGTDDWQQGMTRVTMARLASAIDDQQRVSQPGSANLPRAAKRNGAKFAVSLDEQLLGTWLLIDYEGPGDVPRGGNGDDDGQPQLPDDFRITFHNGSVSITVGGEQATGNFRVNVARAPKQLDMTRSGPAGETDLYIYKIQGNILTMCNQPKSGAPRPTSFQPDKTRGEQLFVFRRVR